MVATSRKGNGTKAYFVRDNGLVGHHDNFGNLDEYAYIRQTR